jgi:hypothetical protein
MVRRLKLVEANKAAVTVVVTRMVELDSVVEVEATLLSLSPVLPVRAPAVRRLAVVLLEPNRGVVGKVLPETNAMEEDLELRTVNAPSAVEVAKGVFKERDIRVVVVDEGILEVSVRFSVELDSVAVP